MLKFLKFNIRCLRIAVIALVLKTRGVTYIGSNPIDI